MNLSTRTVGVLSFLVYAVFLTNRVQTVDETSCTDLDPMPDSDDCTFFYQCSRDENDEWIIGSFQCEPGEFFDSDSRSCLKGTCPEGGVLAQEEQEAIPEGSIGKFVCTTPDAMSAYPKNIGWYFKCVMINGTLHKRIFGCRIIGLCFDPVTESCRPEACPEPPPGTKGKPLCMNPNTVAVYPKNPGWYYKCLVINGTLEKRIMGCKLIGSCFDPETHTCKQGICPNAVTTKDGRHECFNVNTVAPYAENPTWHVKCLMINGTLERRIVGCKPKGTCFDKESLTCKAEVCPKATS